jgi:S-formylglutathione hydrolase FrmB
LYLGCGTEDPLFPGTRSFADAATAAGVDVTVDVRRGGHEWGLWDPMIADVIAWLPRRRLSGA